MKKILGRLFILLPIIIFMTIIGISLIIPFLIWLFTGVSYLEYACSIYDEIRYNLEIKGWA